MNTPKNIKHAIELGNKVGVKHKMGKWRVFTFVRGNGDLEGTASGKSIEECLEYGLIGIDYSELEINNWFTDEIVIIPQKPKLYKVGDKVRIMEIAREIGDFDDCTDQKQEMVGKEFPIEDVYDVFRGIYYEINGYTFPHYCLAPVFEEEEMVTIKISKKSADSLGIKY